MRLLIVGTPSSKELRKIFLKITQRTSLFLTVRFGGSASDNMLLTLGVHAISKLLMFLYFHGANWSIENYYSSAGCNALLGNCFWWQPVTISELIVRWLKRTGCPFLDICEVVYRMYTLHVVQRIFILIITLILCTGGLLMHILWLVFSLFSFSTLYV